MSTTDARPNVLLIMPDQMRGDCLSLERHPAVLTPNIDEIGAKGTHFTRGYTTCASCIPARHSLLTGQLPPTSGMVGFRCREITVPTLPQTLRDAGYQTAIIGRYMHQTPPERNYGYEVRQLGSTYVQDDEYAEELERLAPGTGGVRGHGVSCNGWTAKPWHLPEPLHPTNWVAQRTREFLQRRDRTRPLFLTTSFYAPHPPLIPPAFYLDRYLRLDLPPAAIGDWAEPPGNDALGAGIDAHHTCLRGEALRSAQAGYFGLINHIDDQIYYPMAEFRGQSMDEKRPWLIIFTSDHGEMLGDHYYFRKCEPYEGSSRIPFLIRGGGDLGLKPGMTCKQPVCLEDVMPTILDLAGLPIPDTVDGRSLAPVMRGEDQLIRDVLHCEHATCYGKDQAYHLLTDGRMKYVWRPFDGSEQLFDLDSDPRELRNLAATAVRQTELAEWRARLIERLKDRPEGFTDGAQLIPGRPYPPLHPRPGDS